MRHGQHIFKKVSDMTMATMCAYPKLKYALPHSKCVLLCCEQCSRIDLPSPE